MGLFHVGVDIQRAIGAYRQVLVQEAHLEEVGFLEVGTDRTFDLLG